MIAFETILKMFKNQKYDDWAKTGGSEILTIYKENNKNHKKIIKTFPHWVELCGWFDTHEHAYSVGFNLFGLPHGECVFQDIFNIKCSESEIREFKYLNLSNKKHFAAEEDEDRIKEIFNQLYQENPPCYDHSHIGDWCILFLDHFDVDQSYERYYFKNKEDLDVFKLKLFFNNYEILN